MGSPGCATCHQNHAIQEPSDAFLGLGDKAVCSTCHSQDDEGGKSAVEMRALIDSLASEFGKAHATLERAERAGMEVSQAAFDLNGAREALVKARTAIHGFEVAPVKQEVQTGLSIAQKAYGRGVRALDELGFRKKGLGVSLVIIVALIAGLVMKIRQVDRRRAESVPSERGDA
jgi:hypothetical protein